MDPSIMKKLLEDDEDESMHSGADVDAFQAALNRDIGGDFPASQPSGSDSAVMAQGSNDASNQSVTVPQFQTASRDESTNYQIQQDKNSAHTQETNSSEKEIAQQAPTAENLQQQNNYAPQEVRDLAMPQMQSHEDRQQRPAEQNPLQIPQATGVQISGKNPVTMSEPERPQSLPGSESQYLKLQKMSNQQATVAEQASNPPGRSKQVPFGLLLPVLMNQLDKDKGMQLQELFGKLKRRNLERFICTPHSRSGGGTSAQIGSPYSAITEPSIEPQTIQLQAQASVRKQPTGPPAASSGPTQFTDPRSFPQIHQKGTSSSTDVSHIPSLKAQVQTNPMHQILEKKIQILRETDRQSDSHGTQVSQMPSSNVVATNQERDSIQGLNKQQQQQQLHFPPAPFTTYGGNGGNSNLYSGTNVNTSTLSLKPQPHDSQMRQISQHQNMGPGGETQGANVLGVKLERQNLTNDPSRVHGGSLSHFASNSTNQQKPVPWQPSINKDHSAGPLSSMSYVKPEPMDQANEMQHKLLLSNSQGLPSVSAAQAERGSMSSGSSRDESFEKRPSIMGFSNSAGMGPNSSTSMAPPNSVSSPVAMQLDGNIPLGPRAPSGTSTAGNNNSKTPPKKPSVGQKKPLEALGSSPPPASKKQKVSGNFLDQSIEQLNDVTAVSGVNLREEEEQLFSGPKEDSRVSEASRKAMQEEEERLLLQKTPLQKKLAEIMAKCGLKSISSDVERCLSLSVEERMRGLIDNLIRLSKQRVDAEKSRHQTITTSDIRLQIMTMNQKAKEEWEKKHAEAEKLRKQNDPESSNGVDGEKEKDEGRAKLKAPANKEEDDKMRTTAANVAARAAVGGDDMLSKWQLMAEQARQKREGGTDSASSSQAGKDVNRKPSSTSGRSAKDHQESEKRNFSGPGGVKKFGRNQVIVPQTKVARSITVKDVVALLEREPQMAKSTLVYRLYEKIRSDTNGE